MVPPPDWQEREARWAARLDALPLEERVRCLEYTVRALLAAVVMLNPAIALSEERSEAMVKAIETIWGYPEEGKEDAKP